MALLAVLQRRVHAAGADLHGGRSGDSLQAAADQKAHGGRDGLKTQEFEKKKRVFRSIPENPFYLRFILQQQTNL